MRKKWILLLLLLVLLLSSCSQEPAAKEYAGCLDDLPKSEGTVGDFMAQLEGGMTSDEVEATFDFDGMKTVDVDTSRGNSEVWEYAFNCDSVITISYENDVVTNIFTLDNNNKVQEKTFGVPLTEEELTEYIDAVYDQSMAEDNETEFEESDKEASAQEETQENTIEETDEPELDGPPIDIAVSGMLSNLGEAEGFGGQLLKAALQRLGYPVEFHAYPTQDDEIAALIEGDVSFVLDVDSLYAAQLQNEVIVDGQYSLYYTFPYDGAHTSNLVYLTTDRMMGKELNYIIPELWDDGTFAALYKGFYGAEPPPGFLDTLSQ